MTVTAAGLLCLLLSMGALAGQVLDRLLNQMILDATNGRPDSKHTKTISTPTGQTFTTGADTVEVSRIAVGVAWWSESWTADETLVLTLWDSPARTTKVGEAECPHKWREWEFGVIMFTLDAKVKPSTQYYFELTIRGGDGRIDGAFLGDSYEGGGAFEDGKPISRSIWFEVHSRPRFDRDAAYAERFANWNLDYPGLEKVKAAVAKKDWDAAVDALIAYCEARPDLIEADLAKPKRDPTFDTRAADMAVDMKTKDDEGNIIDLGPNWNYFRTWRTRGGVGLTRTGLRGPFAAAYRATGDEKYAKAFNDMMFSFIDNLPCPLRSGIIKPGEKNVNPSPGPGIAGGSMGGSIGRSTRMNQMFYWYSSFVHSPSFTRDMRAGMIFEMVDSANVIDAQKGGGNRAAIMAAALYEFADRYPELKKSKEWFRKGLDDLFANLMEVVNRDGPLHEPTYGYHCLTVNRYTSTILKCRQWGLEVKPEWEKRTEKALEFILYSMQPTDFRCPPRGDSGSSGIDGTAYLLRMADYYKRPDFLWAGTKGKQGRPPLATSWQFPSDGWFMMRSDWTRDALYMNIRNGYNGSHGHADHNSITLSAYGTNLIADPGVYAYGTAETNELMSTRSHATVTVDDRGTNKNKGPNTWASTRSADFFTGTNTGYQGIDGVTHTRKIVFLKPDYWVVDDTINGTGEHEVAVRYTFHPMELKLGPGGIFSTGNQEGNLIIAPFPGSGFAAENAVYQVPGHGGMQPAPVAKYTKKGQLPLEFAAVLRPFKGSKRPSVRAERLIGGALKIGGPDGTDYVCFGGTSGEVAFTGDTLALRTSAGRVTSAAWVRGTSVSLGGREIASSSSSIENLELAWDDGILTVHSSSNEPSLKVATMGARLLRVGCDPARPITGVMVEPFR